MNRQRLAEATQERGTYAEPIERHGPTYAHDLARHRNERMGRTDIEWAVNDQGQVYLRDTLTFNRWNTDQISRRHENERREWQHNNQDIP